MIDDPEVSGLNKITPGTRYEYPTGIATTDGLRHFMLISELIFKPPTKTNDAFNGQYNFEALVGDESKDYFERGKNFILHLPPGSLKTGYSADYADVNLGIFGDILSQNAQEITDDLISNYAGWKNNPGDKGWGERTMDFYGRMYDDVSGQAKKYTNSKSFGSDFADRIKYNVATAAGSLMPSNAKGEQIASMSMRAARNPYTSLIFTGIKKLREHSFNFEFNPKSAIESKMIFYIIANLKYGMLTGLNKIHLENEEPQTEIVTHDRQNMSPGHPGFNTAKKTTLKINNTMNSAFFSFPNCYRIRFYSNLKKNTFLHRIGNSFLVSLKTKYSPKFFEENGMPTSVGLQLQFKENFTLDRSHAEDY